jgi:hypothetical protein
MSSLPKRALTRSDDLRHEVWTYFQGYSVKSGVRGRYNDTCAILSGKFSDFAKAYWHREDISNALQALSSMAGNPTTIKVHEYNRHMDRLLIDEDIHIIETILG